MKILMLGWELPPFNSGGLGVACYYLCQHAAKHGVSVDFVLPYALPAAHGASFMKVHAVYDQQNAALPFTYDSWHSAIDKYQQDYSRKVEQLIGTTTYDAIHAHDWLTFKAGLHAKKLTGLPLIAHVHSTEFDRAGQQRGNPLAHEIEQHALLMADRIIAVSESTKQSVIERYAIPAKKIDVIYGANSLPAETIQESNAYIYLSRMRQQGYKIVVSLSRLTIQKGLTYLLHAAQKAIRLNPKLIFLIAGDGEQRNELIALSARLGIAHHVVFAGFVRGKQWRDAYHIGDIFVMSSVSEPFGLTALEAAGSGNAVILTKQSGVSEVLPSAIRFDYWDTDRLADFIINIAEQPSLQTSLANNVQREMAALSWNDAAQRLTQVYARTISGATA